MKTDSKYSDITLSRLRILLGELAETGKIVSQVDNQEFEIFPVAIDPVEGQRLRDWVIRESATKTIEIGLGYGLSTLYICEGLLMGGQPKAAHVAMDPHQSGYENCGLQVLEAAGVLDLVEFFETESQILLPRFLESGRNFDFAFVDGSHLFDRVFLDLIYLGRILTPGSIVFVDDYQMPAIERAVSFCTTNLDWTTEEISPEDKLHQWAVLRTALEPKARTFEDYVDF